MIVNPSTNRNRALVILVNAFRVVPGALWVVKNDHKMEQRIQALCEFCLDTSIQKEGAFITSDNNGVALIFDSRKKLKPLPWLLSYIKLGTNCIGWDRALMIIRREIKIQKRRPKFPHLYFWMLATEDNSYGLQTIIELRDKAFEQSRMLNLPIYAETTIKKNKLIYERYGFELYSSWEIPKQNITVWFMKREVT